MANNRLNTSIPHFYLEDYKTESLISNFTKQFGYFPQFYDYDKEFKFFSQSSANEFYSTKKKILFYELFNFIKENNELVHNFNLKVDLADTDSTSPCKKIAKNVEEIIENVYLKYQNILEAIEYKNLGIFTTIAFNCDLRKMGQFGSLEEILHFLQGHDCINTFPSTLINNIFVKVKIQIIVQVYEQFKIKFEFNDNRKFLYCESLIDEEKDINRENLANIFYYIISLVRNALDIDYLILKLHLDDMCPVTEEIKLMKDLNSEGGKNTKIIFVPVEPTSSNIISFVGCGLSIFGNNLLNQLYLKDVCADLFFKYTKFCQTFNISELNLTFTYYNNLVQYNNYFKLSHSIVDNFMENFNNFYFLGSNVKQTYLTINIITLINVDSFLDELLKKILESYNFTFMLNVNIFNDIGNDHHLVYDKTFHRKLKTTTVSLRSAKDYTALYLWDDVGHQLLAKKVRNLNNSLLYFIYLINMKKDLPNFSKKLKKGTIMNLITKYLCSFRLKLSVLKGEHSYITY